MQQSRLRQLFLLEEKDRILLRCLFEPADPDALERLYQDLDFDAERQEYLLFLSRLSQKNGFAQVPQPLVARMKGLIRYHMVNNVLLMQGVLEITDLLREKGIPVMLIKGAAFSACYDRMQPRLMWDTDIAVPYQMADEACQMALSAGFALRGTSPHAVDLVRGNYQVDLHRVVFKRGGEKRAEEIWQKAQKILYQGRELFVPDLADQLIHGLDNEFRNHVVGEGEGRRIKWYYDAAKLIRHPAFPGWQAVAQRAKERGVPGIVRYMLGLFEESLPGWVDKAFFTEYLPDREYRFDEETLLSLRSYAAENDRYKNDVASGHVPHRFSRWLALMKLEYRYMNSEVSPEEGPVSLLQMFLIHWRLDSVWQIPAKVLQRLWNMRKKKGGSTDG